MKKLYNFLNFIFGLPKSMILSTKYFGIKGLFRLPIIVSSKVRLYEIKGKIIAQKVKFGIIKVGFSNKGIFDLKRDTSTIEFGKNMILIIDDSCNFGPNVKLSVSGTIKIGRNFMMSGNNILICQKNISFGDNVLISWGCEFMDTDFHKIIRNNSESKMTGDITVNNNVWICSNVHILKNVKIGSNVVIASNQNLSNIIVGDNVLYKEKKEIKIGGWMR